jgi:hypothetical protein
LPVLFVIPQPFLFVIPQPFLFVIPQRSGGICFSFLLLSLLVFPRHPERSCPRTL